MFMTDRWAGQIFDSGIFGMDHRRQLRIAVVVDHGCRKLDRLLLGSSVNVQFHWVAGPWASSVEHDKVTVLHPRWTYWPAACGGLYSSERPTPFGWLAGDGIDQYENRQPESRRRVYLTENDTGVLCVGHHAQRPSGLLPKSIAVFISSDGGIFLRNLNWR